MSKRMKFAIAAAFATAILCLAPLPQAAAAAAAEINRDSGAAFPRVYARYSSAKALGKEAKAILVFPKIIKAGLMIGARSSIYPMTREEPNCTLDLKGNDA